MEDPTPPSPPLSSELQKKLNQAIEYQKNNNLDKAEEIYNEILQSAPKSYEVLHLLGLIASKKGDYALAVERIGYAIELYPLNPFFYYNFANALDELDEQEAALDNYDTAISIKPDFALAHYNRGMILYGLNRIEEAIISYEKVIAINPNNVDALTNLGLAFQSQQEHSTAIYTFNKAIFIEPTCTDALYNKGNSELALMQIQDAVASFKKVISLDPMHTKAYSNLGISLQEAKQFDAAITSYDMAISTDQHYPEAKINKSMLLLMTGNFEEGYPLYEWRKLKSNDSYSARKFIKPLWLGTPSIESKTILLHSEQGLGDTIQFCRYATLVKSLGAKVILEVQKPLVGLIKTLSNDIQVVEAGAALPEIDYHCPLLSLPYAFKTNINNIPSYLKYLQSDPIKAAKWAQRLGEKNTLRVGLCWAGNPEQANDRNRSMPLKILIEALPEGIEYISLQKEVRNTDRDILQSRPDILDFSHELDDFTDSAALCEQMDVVISVCTSVAHLSCALGKNTWVLLAHVADWRWHTDRNDSPWYPTATLYRQEGIGHWLSVTEKIKANLTKLKNRD